MNIQQRRIYTRDVKDASLFVSFYNIIGLIAPTLIINGYDTKRREVKNC